MKHLKLTETKANELNDICQFAVDRGILNDFDISYYLSQKKLLDKHYYRHLIDIAKQYENVNKLIDLSNDSICATHNTSEFLKTGGFLRILEIDIRENDIQEYTRKNLKQSIFATTDWWIFFSFSTVVTILVTITTTLSVDQLQKRNLSPTTSQDSLSKSLTTYILHLDSVNISYKDSLKIKKKIEKE